MIAAYREMTTLRPLASRASLRATTRSCIACALLCVFHTMCIVSYAMHVPIQQAGYVRAVRRPHRSTVSYTSEASEAAAPEQLLQSSTMDTQAPNSGVIGDNPQTASTSSKLSNLPEFLQTLPVRNLRDSDDGEFWRFELPASFLESESVKPVTVGLDNSIEQLSRDVTARRARIAGLKRDLQQMAAQEELKNYWVTLHNFTYFRYKADNKTDAEYAQHMQQTNSFRPARIECNCWFRNFSSVPLDWYAHRSTLVTLKDVPEVPQRSTADIVGEFNQLFGL
jgi:hypothetical protein